MSQLIVQSPANDDLSPIVDLVTDSLTSENSKIAYARHLNHFLSWMDDNGRPKFTKATVNRYRAFLIKDGKSAASVNQALSAIRKLAVEAADNGLMPQDIEAGINRVKGVSQKGVRSGNWLTLEQAQKMLDLPDVSTRKGLRDRAILAVMIGTGLRRSEVANLTYDHIQLRDDRWVFVDLTGKGNKIRTVPIPTWVKRAIDMWRSVAGRVNGRVFLRVSRGDHVSGNGITPQAIYNTVSRYAAEAGFDVAAHDLRRTFAKLAHKGGALLDQIQLTLGHASVQTTERYLGIEQDLTQAPCDVLGLE